jgi:hypothetical protein
MSDRRRFLKGLTSLPLATVLANARLAAAVSAGLQDVEAKLADGRTVKTALVWAPTKRGKRSQRSSDKENNKPNERYAAMMWA